MRDAAGASLPRESKRRHVLAHQQDVVDQFFERGVDVDPPRGRPWSACTWDGPSGTLAQRLREAGRAPSWSSCVIRIPVAGSRWIGRSVETLTSFRPAGFGGRPTGRRCCISFFMTAGMPLFVFKPCPSPSCIRELGPFSSLASDGIA